MQRFARIDEGVLISLDWWPVRTAALARSADRTKQVPRDSEAHKRHFAVGRIIYEDGEEGILLYVKATVTGDEPDYVLDYERRYPNFPHEATSDQFFSEEQMEAYRALGFHATHHALDQDGAVEAACKGKSCAGKERPCSRQDSGKDRAAAAGRQTVGRQPDRARHAGPQTEGRPRRPGRLARRAAPGGDAIAGCSTVISPIARVQNRGGHGGQPASPRGERPAGGRRTGAAPTLNPISAHTAHTAAVDDSGPCR